jgi:dienelactone hydrolase
MQFSSKVLMLPGIAALGVSSAFSQAYGPPDRGQPGDAMIQQYLALQADRLHQSFLRGIESPEDWEKSRREYRKEYFHMLGLDPRPPRTPLEATVTGTLEGPGYVVDKLHYQSRPRLYVTANLYRPATVGAGERLPAVLYLCGHWNCGRNGNKAAYQSHGIWFARHGYICLVLDSLQLGEIGAIHHGTYREQRWWWHSRGYTPAGVECLNGIRGIDYLVSRPDVDPQRIAVTGISGGGAATFWISAADERARVAVPVSGMADLPSYVGNRVINGHCDCMFLYNTFQWPWTRIAALIAPRPQLFVNSDADRIFPMDANRRVINRLEDVYSLHGAGDCVDSVVSIGGHAYREDIRRAAYRFINTHLENDPRPVTDSEIDLVTGPRDSRTHPIDPERLRVFPEDSDIPADELNTTIDRHFVPLAEAEVPATGRFLSWKAALLAELRRVSFRSFPDRIPAGEQIRQDGPDTIWVRTEDNIEVPVRRVRRTEANGKADRIVLAVRTPDTEESLAKLIGATCKPTDTVYMCAPRGIGETKWTRRNPPNYVERSHALLGRTVDTGRVWDLIAAARYLRRQAGNKVPVHLLGGNSAAILAAYAALWEQDIAGVIVADPPSSHMNPDAPQFLNVLRVCDIPEALGLLAPRALTIVDCEPKTVSKVGAIYASAGAPHRLSAGD